MKTTLSRHDILRIAVEAEADPRTVQKVLRGEPITKGTAGQRISRAMVKLGFVGPYARISEQSV